MSWVSGGTCISQCNETNSRRRFIYSSRHNSHRCSVELAADKAGALLWGWTHKLWSLGAVLVANQPRAIAPSMYLKWPTCWRHSSTTHATIFIKQDMHKYLNTKISVWIQFTQIGKIFILTKILLIVMILLFCPCQKPLLNLNNSKQWSKLSSLKKLWRKKRAKAHNQNDYQVYLMIFQSKIKILNEKKFEKYFMPFQLLLFLQTTSFHL